jgi:hypothetical protein
MLDNIFIVKYAEAANRIFNPLKTNKIDPQRAPGGTFVMNNLLIINELII